MKFVKYFLITFLLTLTCIVYSQDETEAIPFLSYFEHANASLIHRPMRTSAPVPGEFYGRPRSDGVVFSMAGYRTMSIGTTDSYKKIFYHLPGDDPDVITIDIMEDVAKLIYIALTDIANDQKLTFRKQENYQF